MNPRLEEYLNEQAEKILVDMRETLRRHVLNEAPAEVAIELLESTLFDPESLRGTERVWAWARSRAEAELVRQLDNPED